MQPQALADLIASGRAPAMLDVRSPAEFAEGHLAGAVNIPFWRFLVSLPRVPADPGEPLIVYCGHGPRAKMAMAALRRRGYRRTAELEGHMAAWRAARLPLD